MLHRIGSSGMWHSVVWLMRVRVSKESATIHSAYPEDGDHGFLRKISNYVASHSIKQIYILIALRTAKYFFRNIYIYNWQMHTHAHTYIYIITAVSAPSLPVLQPRVGRWLQPFGWAAPRLHFNFNSSAAAVTFTPVGWKYLILHGLLCGDRPD
jgi:hypothetical protein